MSVLRLSPAGTRAGARVGPAQVTLHRRPSATAPANRKHAARRVDRSVRSAAGSAEPLPSILESRASRSVRMPVPVDAARSSGGTPAPSMSVYLRERDTRDRLVRVVFPDTNRRRKLSPQEGGHDEDVCSLYEVQMLPMQFQSIPGLSDVRVSCILEVRNGGSNAEPSSTSAVAQTPTPLDRSSASGATTSGSTEPVKKMRGMAISMRDVRMSNLPADMLVLNDRLAITLNGRLKAVIPKSAGTASPVTSKAKPLVLVGNVELKLRAELPYVLAIVPGIQGIVDSVMLTCLKGLEDGLTAGIIDDYNDWADSVVVSRLTSPAGAEMPREEGVVERVYQ